MVGWIFKQDRQLSALIIMPNDGNYENNEASGERFFVNPLKNLSWLHENHIHYNKKNLYLFGKVSREHISVYCPETDSLSALYYHGNPEWEEMCFKAAHIPDLTTRLPGNSGMDAVLKSDTVNGFHALTIFSQGQKLVFSWGLNPKEDSVSLYIDLAALSGTPDDAEIFISSNGAFQNGNRAPDIEIRDNSQALGFSIDNKNKLLIKKLWLANQIK